MRILITGAGGFVGQLLTRAILTQTTHSLTITDITEPQVPDNAPADRLISLAADLTDQSALSRVVTKDLDAIYILHGIMSSGSEQNFDLGLKVNIDSTRKVLDAIRHTCRPSIKVLYASSQAVYGQPLPDPVTEETVPAPESSYGAQKMVCEYLINDYNRRGFITAFTFRFPTIVVRPGAPSAAASSFLSGLIREPLKGEECVIPVTDRTLKSWVCSPQSVEKNLLHVLTLKGDELPPHRRTINHPGIQVTTQDMMDALAKVCGDDKLRLLKEERDEALERILLSWPQNFDNKLAYDLGFVGDRERGFEGCVRDYAESVGFSTKS